MFPLLKISKRTPGVTQMLTCPLEVMQSVYKPSTAIGKILAST